MAAVNNQAAQMQALIQANSMARGVIANNAVKMRQLAQAVSVATPGATNNVVNIVPRNVGLITGFMCLLKPP